MKNNMIFYVSKRQYINLKTGAVETNKAVMDICEINKIDIRAIMWKCRDVIEVTIKLKNR